MDYVIHIGLPKTGSTSIQKFLSRNRDVICDQRGVLYAPVPERKATQHGGILHSVAKGDGEAAKSFIGGGLATAKARGATTIIWSSERLSSAGKGSLSTLGEALAAHGEPGRVRVIAYFRNIYDRLLSRINQALKHSDWPVEPSAYRDDILNTSPSQTLAKFETQFGAGCVDARIFEQAVRGGLNQDFCAAAGVAWSDDFVEEGPDNTSADLITAHIFNTLRTEFDLPATLMSRLVGETRFATPRIDAALLKDIPADAKGFDLSHPLLAPHAELLTRRPDPGKRAAPALDDFLDHLEEVLREIREGGRRKAKREGKRDARREG